MTVFCATLSSKSIPDCCCAQDVETLVLVVTMLEYLLSINISDVRTSIVQPANVLFMELVANFKTRKLVPIVELVFTPLYMRHLNHWQWVEVLPRGDWWEFWLTSPSYIRGYFMIHSATSMVGLLHFYQFTVCVVNHLSDTMKYGQTSMSRLDQPLQGYFSRELLKLTSTLFLWHKGI